MADFTCNVTFKDVEAGERIWLYVISRGQGIRAVDTQRTWTDCAEHEFQLTDQSDQSTTEHALIAFRRRCPPLWTLFTPPAAGGTTALNLSFNNEVILPICIWIVAGEFERQRLRALNAVLLANLLLCEEGTGIRLQITEFMDATNVASRFLLSEKVTWDKNYAVIAERARTIGLSIGCPHAFDKNVLNVFYVDSFLSDNVWKHGIRCDQDGRFAVAIDRFGLDDLLLHEIGHTLSLGDVKGKNKDIGAPNRGLYDCYNVMRMLSHRRYFFTEGQIIGMHFNPESVLNTGRISDRRDQWYKETSEPLEVKLNGRPSLAEDHLALLRSNRPLPLQSMSRAEEDLEDQVAASRVRYFLRTLQLELESTDMHSLNNKQKVLQIAPDVWHRLLQISVDDYVAADLARLYEFHIHRTRSAFESIAYEARRTRDQIEAITPISQASQVNLLPGIQNTFNHLICQAEEQLWPQKPHEPCI